MVTARRQTPAPAAPGLHRSPPSLREILAVSAAFLLLTILLTLPLCLRMTTHICGDVGDNYAFLWQFRWFSRALTELGVSPFHAPDLNFPRGSSIFLNPTTLFNTLLSIPLQRVLPVVAVYNLLVLFSFWMAALTAYLLTRHLDRTPLASFLAGFVYAFSAYHYAHALGHLTIVSTEWIPLFVLYLLQSLRTGRPRPVALAALFLVLSALCSWYFLLSCSLFVAAATVPFLLPRHGKRRGLGPVPAAAAVLCLAVAALSPMLVPMMREAAARPSVAGHAPAHYPADLAGFFVPGFTSTFGMLFLPIWTRFRANPIESATYVGWSVLLLAGAAFYPRFPKGPRQTRSLRRVRLPGLGGTASPRGGSPAPGGERGSDPSSRGAETAPEAEQAAGLPPRDGDPLDGPPESATAAAGPFGPAFWAYLLAVFFVLSLGPFLNVLGRDLRVPLPYLLLQHLVPFASVAGVPARLHVISTLCLALLAAFGLDRIRGRAERTGTPRGPARKAAAAGLLLLLLVDHLHLPLYTARHRVSPFYEALGRDPARYALIDFTPRGKALFCQSIHLKGLIRGYVARGWAEQGGDFLETETARCLFGGPRAGEGKERCACDGAEARETLRAYGVRYLVYPTIASSSEGIERLIAEGAPGAATTAAFLGRLTRPLSPAEAAPEKGSTPLPGRPGPKGASRLLRAALETRAFLASHLGYLPYNTISPFVRESERTVRETWALPRVYEDDQIRAYAVEPAGGRTDVSPPMGEEKRGSP